MSNQSNKNASGPVKVTAGAAAPQEPAGNMPPEAAAKAADGQTPAAPDTPQETERPTGRRPLGRREAKLHYAPRNGFVRRWINEWPGRIGNAIAGGWTHVTERGKPVTRVVGTAEAGGPLHAYLMEIPQSLYDEDAVAKLEGLNEIDQQIYGGTFNAQPGDLRYVPESGIKMRNVQGRGA